MRENLKRSHTARILSDEVNFVAFLAMAVAHATEQKKATLHKAYKETKPFFDLLKSMQEGFYGDIAGKRSD
jgi:hypothetical protein